MPNEMPSNDFFNNLNLPIPGQTAVPNNGVPKSTTPSSGPTGSNGDIVLDISDTELAELFPDLYQKIAPHIAQIAEELRKQEMTDSMLDAVVGEILQQSEMGGFGAAAPQPSDAAMEVYPEDAEYDPVFYQYPAPCPDPYCQRRRYPRYYYDMSLEDLIRLMLLQRLGGYYY